MEEHPGGFLPCVLSMHQYDGTFQGRRDTAAKTQICSIIISGATFILHNSPLPH